MIFKGVKDMAKIIINTIKNVNGLVMPICPKAREPVFKC